jgi:lactate dehydrogenase-like 2-hydroxyacid dehydrogenase
MPNKKPLVIVTRKLPDAIETRMRELFDARLNVDDIPMSREQLTEAVQTADVIVPTVTDRLDARILSRASEKLRLIANFGAGVDNIDLESARARGITVTNTPGVLTDDTADITMALILAVPRRIVEGASIISKGDFKGWSPTWMLGQPHLRQAPRHHRHGPHRPGCCAPRQGVRPADPLSQPQGRREASRKSSRQPTGTASTRCSRAWTSCR